MKGLGALICVTACLMGKALLAQQVAPELVPPAGWRDAGKAAEKTAGLTPPAGWADGGAGFGGVPCTISPLQTVDLAAPFAGIIEKVLVKPGQSVAKGDVIAQFDAAAARSELAIAELRAHSTKSLEIAKSRAAGLQKRLDRLTSAQSSRAVPAAELENAQLESDVAAGEVQRENEVILLAKLEADRARILVEKSTVTSPVSGSIGETLIDPGETPGQAPIATIYVTDPMKIEAYLPTNAVASFLQKTSYHAEIAGKSYAVTLDHRANVADLSSNTLSVFFRISAPDVLPGYDCKIIAQNAPDMPKE